MQAISHFLSVTQTANRPILTHYHSFRDEISGPVAARWVAKMANLLASDLSPDLFGGDENSANFMGWETRTDTISQDSPSIAFSFDVHVSDELVPLEASTAAWRLAHSITPLAMRWRGPLPAGILDALAELMAQSDQFEYEALESAPALDDYIAQVEAEEEALFKAASELGMPARLGLYTKNFPSAPLLTRLWLAGHSVVVVDKSHYGAQKAQEIFASEKVQLTVDEELKAPHARG